MNEENENKKPGLSRRKFIRNTGLAAAGFMIIPRHVLGGKGFIAPSDRLTIAS
ncbi:MAG: twin-arginine translocation signal domain-containing protein, partial [Ginsengibacter sp.]